MFKRRQACIAGIALLLLPAPAHAQTTTSYEYDVHGRLLRSERNSGATTRTRYTYDPADNRAKVKQGNTGPTAINDYGFAEDYGPFDVYVLDNDTDDDLPFDTQTITALSGTHAGSASIQGGGQFIRFYAGIGNFTFSYTMKDSQNLTSTAQVFLEVVGPINCPPDC